MEDFINLYYISVYAAFVHLYVKTEAPRPSTLEVFVTYLDIQCVGLAIH